MDPEDLAESSDIDGEEKIWAADLAIGRQWLSSSSISHIPSQPVDLLPALNAKVRKFLDLTLFLLVFSPQPKAPVVRVVLRKRQQQRSTATVILHQDCYGPSDVGKFVILCRAKRRDVQRCFRSNIVKHFRSRPCCS